jgi:hypothetical protein
MAAQTRTWKRFGERGKNIMMEQTGNFLTTMVQDKMNRSMPQNAMAQKELDFVNQNPNYLKEKYAMGQNRDKLQYTQDVMVWAVKSLNFIGPEEYPQFRQTAIQYGLSPAILPESFESPEAFQEFKIKTNMGAPEFAKMMQGKPVTMSKVTDDGLISAVEAASPEEVAGYAKSGYTLGKLSGTPSKPDKPQYEHKPFYDSAGKLIGYKSIEKGKDFTFGEGEFGNAPDSSSNTDPTPQQAYKRISDIQKARAELGKSSEITQMLAMLNPELKGMVGQPLDPETKSQLNEAWDKEIGYLQQYTTASKKTAEFPTGLTQNMLDQYKAKYPDKTEDEIKNAWKKRMQ